MKLPSIGEIINLLLPIKDTAKKKRLKAKSSKQIEECYISTRLQLCENGTYHIYSGDIQYDQDHTGYWGDDYIGPDSDLIEVGNSLLDQVADQVYIHGEEED